jgi:hypothetical protein
MTLTVAAAVMAGVAVAVAAAVMGVAEAAAAAVARRSPGESQSQPTQFNVGYFFRRPLEQRVGLLEYKRRI